MIRMTSLVVLVICQMSFLATSYGDDANKKLELGRKIYSQQCAQCHGSEGQGTQVHYEARLEGDLALSELAELISDTMPEEDPDQCVGEDAAAVAKFVFKEFYSAEAQYRRNAPRVQLSRRTVRQYKNSVADLIASFHDPMWIPDERGLQAHYFAASYWNEKRRLAQETDDRIDFGEGVKHFRADGKYEGVEDTKKDNKMGDGFYVVWSGGLVAPQSGEYEFSIHCRNGFKLYVNDLRAPLIDRWVRSNDDLIHSGKVSLLAGRPYSFKLELFNYEDPETAIQLFWKLPNGTQEVVPAKVFTPHNAPEVLALATTFPADDASEGYERGVSVSQQWEQATTSAAVETAEWVAKRIWRLANTRQTDGKRTEKVKKFCLYFVERAFANALSSDDRRFFVDQHFENDLSIHDQVKRVVILALKSPRFLYPELQERDANFEIASRAALVLLDGLPDKMMIQKAKQGKLTEDNEKYGQLYRLLHDSRSRQKLRNFFHKWLKSEHLAEATKDESLYPTFSPQLMRDLETSLDLFLDEVIWSDSSDYRQLFLNDQVWANQTIGQFYGLADEDDQPIEGFQRLTVDKIPSAGLLTHPYLMAGLAYHNESSPIHRGVFVARSLLGRRLRQPPDDVEPLTEAFNPKMTTRERVEHQTKDTACMNCHSVINPLGFALENYDAVGRFRSKEKEKPVNASSNYTTPSGQSVELTGARDLAEFLAKDELAQKNFISQLFRHYAKQPIVAYGQNKLDELHDQFVAENYNVTQLLIKIAIVVIEHDARQNNQVKSDS